MESAHLNRFSPLLTASGKILRNRVVVPPMASQTAGKTGLVTEQTLAHYARLAEARPGLLIVEYTYVHDSGRSEDHQLGIQSGSHVEGLGKLAATIKSSGALAGIQITHSGGKSESAMTGGKLMGPSAIPVPVKDRQMEAPVPMTADEIALWRNSFLAAADRAVNAGFDLVEFHAAHGYGLNQWLSPITNQREDQYGSHRQLLLEEIVSAVRARYPRLLLSVRIPGQDFIPGGLEIADTVRLARTLERLGVNFIHVSSGLGGWRRPSPRAGEGYLVDEAEKIQAAVNIPVIGVGGIETGAYIDRALQDGRFQLAAVGRAILKGPYEWAQTNLKKENTHENFNRASCDGVCIGIR